MSNVRHLGNHVWQSLQKVAKTLPLVVALGAASPAAAQPAPPPVQRPTFQAAIAGLALPQSGVMDAVCISGSAIGKIVRIKRIEISGVNPSAAQSAAASLILRSAANAGGTSTVLTNVAADQSNIAGTATVRAYTVAPTPGTAIGTVRAAVV